jgi:hypothetical protein
MGSSASAAAVAPPPSKQAAAATPPARPTPAPAGPRPVPAAPVAIKGAASGGRVAIRTDVELELNPLQRWLKMNLSMLSSAAVHLTLIVLLGLFYIAKPVKNFVELIVTTSPEDVSTNAENLAPIVVDIPETSLTPLPDDVNSMAAFNNIASTVDIAPPAIFEAEAKDPLAAGKELSEQLGKGIGDGFEDGVGSIGMLAERLKKAGAQTGDVQISLMWNNINDLDLYVRTPTGEIISFRHRVSISGGRLDVDMNALLFNKEPVENIFWPKGRAPKGEYTISVDYFANHGEPDPTKFGVAAKIDGELKTFSGTISFGQPPMVIYKFIRK